MADFIRAHVESGEEFEDPSEDLLYMLLTEIEQGREQFVIVERVSDPTGQTYAQAMRLDDRRWTVEHRAGSPDQHFVAFVPDLRDAHELLTQWAFEVSGWDTADAWSRLDLT